METGLLWLDRHEEFSNFHLLFLLNITKHLGFYPNNSNNDYDYFNLYEGKFQKGQNDLYVISGQNVRLLKQLMQTKFDEINTIKLNSNQRQSFLDTILLYFELHLEGFKKPKSLQLFNQVFH